MPDHPVTDRHGAPLQQGDHVSIVHGGDHHVMQITGIHHEPNRPPHISGSITVHLPAAAATHVSGPHPHAGEHRQVVSRQEGGEEVGMEPVPGQRRGKEVRRGGVKRHAPPKADGVNA